MGKKVTRTNCYETNSSSMHSIVVTKNDTHEDPLKILWNRDCEEGQFDSVYLDKKGKWSLWRISNGFGRSPFKILTSFEDKIKYAMCEYLGTLYEDDPEWERIYGEFENIAYQTIPGFTGFDIHKKYVDIYTDEDGNDILTKNVHYGGYDEKENKDNYFYYNANGEKRPAILNEEECLEMPDIGMIDHQSMGLLRNFLRDQNITLMEFLTNKRYIIVITGDEYDDWPRYKASGLIDKSFIVSEYTTSGEDLEYMEWLKEQEENENNQE